MGPRRVNLHVYTGSNGGRGGAEEPRPKTTPRVKLHVYNSTEMELYLLRLLLSGVRPRKGASRPKLQTLAASGRQLAASKLPAAARNPPGSFSE